MSFKLKDLHFDNAQPAFLRRLRGELTGEDLSRQTQPIQRSKRLEKDDDEDNPTYVLEGTNQSLTKKEYDTLFTGDNTATNEAVAKHETSLEQQDESVSKDKIAVVTTSIKKRKIAKVISTDDDHQKEEKATEASNTHTKNTKNTKKQKLKKTKAVKLTFGEDGA